MKFNIEVELDYIAEDYTVSDMFRDELVRQSGIAAARILADQDFKSLLKDEQLNIIKGEYEKAIKEIKYSDQEKTKQALAKIDDAFENLIKGIAFRVNSLGIKDKEYTVGEFIQDRVLEQLKNAEKTIESIITKAVNEKIKLSEYQIKNLVDSVSKNVQNENAKAVAEFIVKGIRT